MSQPYERADAPYLDPGHKAMRFVYTLTGNVPRHV